MQKYGLFLSSTQAQAHEPSFSFSTAEKKLLVIFTYYILMQIFSFAFFSLSEQTLDALWTELFHYFICEQNENDPANPCSRSEFERLVYGEIKVPGLILTLAAPIMNFIFVVDYLELKEYFQKRRK